MNRIIIIDDHDIVRDGYKALFLGNKEFKIIGEASNSEELFEILKTQVPEIIILDIELPTLSGIEIMKILADKYPQIKVLILSGNLIKEDNIYNSINAGALGILPKHTKKEELFKALNKVKNGNEFYSDYVTDILLKKYINKTKLGSKYENKKEINLSEREIQIIKNFANGYSYKEIANKLYISPRTVESHKVNILNKLNLHTMIDIVKYAIKNHIITI